MVIKQSRFNEKADRAFARSAIHSEHFNISIRAVFGERNSSALQADSPIEAGKAVEELVELGLTKIHE